MFGLRVAYAINPRWSLHYLSEAFYIELGDEFKGSFQNNELTVQYRFPKHFIVGAGITRFSTDLDADDDDWEGKLADNLRGLLVFGSYRY